MSLKHDPVSALKEDEATGETAVLFEEIRTTMQIPMLTSIWRILASSLENLKVTWQLTRPLFETSYPEAVLASLRTSVIFPMPAPLVEGQLQASGVKENDLSIIRAIVDAYTRSNTLNMIALTALVVEPSSTPAERSQKPNPMHWPTLPDVPEESDMAPSTWALVNALNTFGATPDEPGLATLWRHLAYWPGFLAVVHAGFAPLQENQEIKHSVMGVLNSIHSAGQRLAHHRLDSPRISSSTRAMLAKYVQHPGLVARMVVIGHSLSNWLQAPPTIT